MRLVPLSNLNIIKVCQVCGRSIDDDDARCWMSGGRTEFGSPCREIVKVPNFRQFGFSAKRRPFRRSLSRRGGRAGIAEGTPHQGRTVRVWYSYYAGSATCQCTTQCSMLIECRYDLELCEQIMLIHCADTTLMELISRSDIFQYARSQPITSCQNPPQELFTLRYATTTSPASHILLFHSA